MLIIVCFVGLIMNIMIIKNITGEFHHYYHDHHYHLDNHNDLEEEYLSS